MTDAEIVDRFANRDDDDDDDDGFFFWSVRSPDKKETILIKLVRKKTT